jgi:RimJ/RimL family protein N-acetyltransferase
VLETGYGACFVDRWPAPRTVLAGVAGNFSLQGDAGAVPPQELRERVWGFVEAEPGFVPPLEAAFPALRRWDRVILELDGRPHAVRPPHAEVRRLGRSDAWHLFGLGADVEWIAKTLGGPAGLAASGLAFGAFVDGALASVAAPFFRGARYEDLGVVTEPRFRGRGLSPACAARLAQDARSRGRRLSWSTSPDNAASLAVAAKLGFREQRRDVLYVVDAPVPEPARKPVR